MSYCPNCKCPSCASLSKGLRDAERVWKKSTQLYNKRRSKHRKGKPQGDCSECRKNDWACNLGCVF